MTWEEIGNLPEYAGRFIVLGRAWEHLLYLASTEGGAVWYFRSSDGAKNWHTFYQGDFDWPKIYAGDEEPLGVYSFGVNQLLYSNDAAKSWAAISPEFHTALVGIVRPPNRYTPLTTGLAELANGKLVVGTSKGLFWFSRGAPDWGPVGGFEGQGILGVERRPEAKDEFFVTTNDGVFSVMWKD
jgi:hypothetical protein